ncbi:MAG TPA: uroporphyrinogen decarboxylase family protein [Anaerolineales bacterium]|nr:uroporphyrinogen decarboxylase family protein [Anaerolineales bacterium]
MTAADESQPEPTSLTQPDFHGRFLTAVYCQGEPDRVPLVESGINAGIKARFLGRPIRALADEAAFWAAAGYDLVPLEAGLRPMLDAAFQHEQSGRFESGLADPPAVAAAKAFAIHRLSQGHPEPLEVGSVRQNWASRGEGFIHSFADLEAFPWPDPHDLDFSPLRTIREGIPSGMGAIAFAGTIFTCLLLMLGVEGCLIGIARETELFRALLRKVGEFQLKVVEDILGFRTLDGIWISDDLAHKSAAFVEPELFRKYIFPYYRELRDLTRAKGLPLLLHSDGNLTQIIPDLVEIGFNAIHPIEPDCMDIEETRRLVGPRVCLIGNLSLGYPLGSGSPQEVARETEALIRKVAPGGGYCLSSASSITDAIPYENWDAMRKTALEAGVYPIRPAEAQPRGSQA